LIGNLCGGVQQSNNSLVSEDQWAHDASGNLLTQGTSMTTRSHNIRNQLTQIGGAGSTVVEGTLNEYATVTVNGQAAQLQSDPANSGYRFRKEVQVSEGNNTVQLSATDREVPPKTTNKNYQFSIGTLQKSYQYDKNGNMTHERSGGPTGPILRKFTWDAKSQLRSITLGGTGESQTGGTIHAWQYDFEGRRLREYTHTVGTAQPTNPVKQFVWNTDTLLQERTGTSAVAGSVVRTHYSGGFLDEAGANDRTYQTLTDHLGNIPEILNANAAAASFTGGSLGGVAARYDYTAFQGPIKVSGPTTLNASVLTIGRYYHHEASGLEFAKYRAYDPALGRWLNEDPIEEEGEINLYGFVRNGPIQFVDFLGLTKGGN
jgi:RHS repeat-associated protein